MTYERFTIVLTEPEMKILRKLAQQDLRRPRDQATYLLRTALLREPFTESVTHSPPVSTSGQPMYSP